MGVEILDKEFDLERMYVEKEDGTSIKEQIHKAIETLPEKQCRAIKLFYFDELLQEEIALILGVQQPAVSKLLARGLQGIKSFLKNF